MLSACLCPGKPTPWWWAPTTRTHPALSSRNSQSRRYLRGGVRVPAGSHGHHGWPGGLCSGPPCPGVCVPEESPVPLILRVNVPWGVHGVPHPCTAIPWGVPAPIQPSGQVHWVSPCSRDLPRDRGPAPRVHFIPAGDVTWGVPAPLRPRDWALQFRHPASTGSTGAIPGVPIGPRGPYWSLWSAPCPAPWQGMQVLRAVLPAPGLQEPQVQHADHPRRHHPDQTGHSGAAVESRVARLPAQGH